MTYQDIESNHRRRFVCDLLSSTLVLMASVPAEVLANSSVKIRHPTGNNAGIPDSAIRDAIYKARNFEQDYPDDLFLSAKDMPLLDSALGRLTRIQRIVGYANFALISFDDVLKVSRAYHGIGEFTRAELEFIERVYLTDARLYGFLGEKVSKNLTDNIKHKDVLKLRGTGHYLYRGESLALYHKLQKKMGKKLILTSGIRGVVKQLRLFLAKSRKTRGNLSRAARSLAPPGHSFHGIGDFDVGQRGLGAANFTSVFARTELYRRMCDQGYIRVRYPDQNPFGVRFEPWHIKVVDHA